MKKKMAAKKGKKRKHKKHESINNTMERGQNGKYNRLYNEAKELQTRRKPQDRTPTSIHITQDKGQYAAAKYCNCKGMPLAIRH